MDAIVENRREALKAKAPERRLWWRRVLMFGGVFVVVVGLIVGSYFAITALPGMMANRELDQRLRDVSFTTSDGSEVADASVLRKMVEGTMPVVDEYMKKSRGGSWLARLIEQSGVQTTPSAILLVTVILAVALGFVTALFVSQPYAAPIVACIGNVQVAGRIHRDTARSAQPGAGFAARSQPT